tara:strand:+ start:4255 stop:4815 length:561 start_codon:yes stop_codon:yes gene_type:complete
MKKEKTYTYEQVGMILMLISFAMLSIATLWRSEIDMEKLNKQLEHKQFQIDSLKHEIDTLQWENQIWDFNLSNNTVHLLSAIIHVESSNNDSAYRASEDAVGCLQIRKCMVNDVNRILRRQGKDHRFTYDDRWLRHKSIQMFSIYCKHYGLTSAEEIARCWNGGPKGMQNEITATYWKKVQKNLDS